MLMSLDDMLDSMVKNQLKVSHLEKKVTSKVIPVNKINTKFKNLITKEYDAKLIKDADYIIAFYENAIEPVQEEPKDEPEEQEEVDNTETQEKDTTNSDEQKDTETDSEDEDTETDSEDEDTETDSEDEDTEDEKKKDKNINESVKIEDLTKSMLSTPKPTTPSYCKCKEQKKTSCECGCKKNATEAKKEDKIEEAETEATGEELRSKVAKAVENVFKSQVTDSNKIEFYDIKSTKENCYFTKITIKTRDSQTEEQ